MTTLKSFLFLLILLLTSCIGAGTLGGFEPWTFTTSKQNLVNAIDTFFTRFPDHKVPAKWKSHDDWKERGYDFLESRIFYFKNGPEEMYYVSFLGDGNNSVQVDTNRTSISIRAVNTGNAHWTLEDETSSSEKKRIENRFEQEIVSKLEAYTKSTSIRDY